MGARLSSTQSIIGLPATSRSGFALQSERIEPGGVTGGEDEDIHGVGETRRKGRCG